MAGPWKGKLSAESVAPWILQDIGYTGILMLVLYLVQFGILVSRSNNVFTVKLASVRLRISQILILDVFGASQRCFNQGSLSAMPQVLQRLSFATSVFFLLCFSSELVWQFHRQEYLSRKPQDTLTKSEKLEKEIYFDGLEEKELSTSMFVRHNNLIFTVKILLIQTIIYSL